MKLTYILIFSSFLYLNSCSEDLTEVNTGSSGIVPLKIGNIWEYEHFMYDSLGNILDTYTITEQIAKDTLINGVHLYSDGITKIYSTNKEDGLWIYVFYFDGNQDNTLYYKYPCKQGDKYMHSFGRPPAEVTVISTNEVVEVPAGKFTCILYRLYFQELLSHTNIYVAPGIGKIKHEHFSRGDIGTPYKDIEEHLLSYQIK